MRKREKKKRSLKSYFDWVALACPQLANHMFCKTSECSFVLIPTAQICLFPCCKEAPSSRCLITRTSKPVWYKKVTHLDIRSLCSVTNSPQGSGRSKRGQVLMQLVMKWKSDILIMYTTQSDSCSFSCGCMLPHPLSLLQLLYLGQCDRQTEKKQGDSQVFLVFKHLCV